MSSPTPAARGTVTRILDAVERGEARAADELLPLVYDELRRQAGSYMASLVPGQTLQATALVHDAYLRLVGKQDPGWRGRGHFYGVAARAMREILIEQARRKASLKHGGHVHKVGEEDLAQLTADGSSFDVLSLDEALDSLEQEDPRKAELVMLRFFGGLSMPEVAAAMGISTATAYREWLFAKVWLRRELRGSEEPSG